VPQHQSSVHHVCSSAMFVNLKGRGSVRSTRVSLINAGMRAGFVRVARCGSTPQFVEVGGRW